MHVKIYHQNVSPFEDFALKVLNVLGHLIHDQMVTGCKHLEHGFWPVRVLILPPHIWYSLQPVPNWDSSPCYMAPSFNWRSEKNLSSARLPLCLVNQPTSLELSCLLCCIVFIDELAWSWWCCTEIWFDMQAHDNNNNSHHSFLFLWIPVQGEIINDCVWIWTRYSCWKVLPPLFLITR